MIIRRGELDDLGAICAIERASFGDPWSESDFRTAFGDPLCEYMIARDGAEVIGYGLFSVLYEDAEILSLAVDPARRRCGVGKEMLSRLVERAREKKAERIFLEVRASNASAIALYSGAGFKTVRTIKRYYRRPVEDAIAMSLELNV